MLAEDRWAKPVVYTPNVVHIPAFVSMVMAYKAEPSALNLLIGFLAKVVSACPSAASLATDGFLLPRRPSVSGLEIGSTISDDQGYLKVLCAVIALSQFDLSRYCRILLLCEHMRYLLSAVRVRRVRLLTICTSV